MKFSETREALGYLTIVIFALSVIAFAALFVDALDSRERRKASESYAGRNPEVQIVSVSRQQYGKPKWNTWQLVVEMRGTKTGETLIVREKEDRLFFSQAPQPGETWHIWITDRQPYSLPWSFTFQMEPVHAKP